MRIVRNLYIGRKKILCWGKVRGRLAVIVMMSGVLCAITGAPFRSVSYRAAGGDKLADDAKATLLIVDEFGHQPFEPNAAHLFFQLVSRRYERGSTLEGSSPAGRGGALLRSSGAGGRLDRPAGCFSFRAGQNRPLFQ